MCLLCTLKALPKFIRKFYFPEHWVSPSTAYMIYTISFSLYCIYDIQYKWYPSPSTVYVIYNIYGNIYDSILPLLYIYDIQYLQSPSPSTAYMIYNIYDIILSTVYMIYNIYDILLSLHIYDMWCIWYHPSSTVYIIYNIFNLLLPLLFIWYIIYMISSFLYYIWYTIYTIFFSLYCIYDIQYIWCHPPSIVYIILKSLGDYSVFNNLISLLLPYFLLAKTRSCYYRHVSVIPKHLKLGSINLLYHWSPWLNLKPFLL